MRKYAIVSGWDYRLSDQDRKWDSIEFLYFIKRWS